MSAPIRGSSRSAMLLLALALLTGCGSDSPLNSTLSPAGREGGRRPGEGDEEWFTDKAEATGLDFVHFNGMSGELYIPEIMSGGCALLDYDNDGDLDIFLVQGNMLGAGKTLSDALFSPQGPSPLRARLYRNDLEVRGDGSRTLRFTDVTEESRIDAQGYGMGVAAGDIDNDGCVDLYLTNFGPNQMWRNNCDGTFADVSGRSGTDDAGWSVSASFLDYDRDGWLDLYVGNYVHYSTETDAQCQNVRGGRDYCTPQVFLAQPDRLYRNQRNGRFVDVTAAALEGGYFGPALGVATADFDGDGWIDIYVANDGTENQLWLNQRNGTFKDTGLVSGAALSEDGKPEGSMGVDAGDFDNDGDEDLFMTHLPGQGNNLYVNDGSGTFEDQSARSGLGPFSLEYTGFGTAWLDFDNDGWLDILAVNGRVSVAERMNNPFPYDERNLLFRNLRNGRFEDVTDRSGAVFKLSEVSRGAAFGDIDNDGDVDVLVSNNNGRARLLVNNIGNRNHWVGLRLVGADAPRPLTSSGRPEPFDSVRPEPVEGRTFAQDRLVEGRDMLGVRVGVFQEGRPTLWRRVRADGSYASANDPRVLVGLGNSAAAPRVQVRWPSGRVEEWPEVAIDRWTTLKEGGGR